MSLIVISVVGVAFSMIMTAIYVAFRSHIFGTTPSMEFNQLCANSLDRILYKTANKSRITMLLAEKGTEGKEYLQAAVDVENHIFDKYIDELEHEGRIEKVPNAGQATVYKLADKTPSTSVRQSL